MFEPDYQAIITAPGFSLGVRCSTSVLSAIDFLTPRKKQDGSNTLAQKIEAQLYAYLKSPQHVFELPFLAQGTAFQQQVWQQILKVPVGKTRFYSELADALDSAPRAVGQACGANPIPIIIPCHRIVAKQGLGGFNKQSDGFSPEVKKWLLRHEGSLPASN